MGAGAGDAARDGRRDGPRPLWCLYPKLMELAFGRALFHRYACQAAAMVELLEAAVAEMHDRAEEQFGEFDPRPTRPPPGFCSWPCWSMNWRS